MRDARMKRRPANRVVELTAWDVLSLSFDSGNAGHFKEGQRFQVSLVHMMSTPWEYPFVERSRPTILRSRICCRHRKVLGWIVTRRARMCTSARAKFHGGPNYRCRSCRSPHCSSDYSCGRLVDTHCCIIHSAPFLLLTKSSISVQVMVTCSMSELFGTNRRLMDVTEWYTIGVLPLR